jgi:putative PIG3 family NAD(P)H quinone oxidoreductase
MRAVRYTGAGGVEVIAIDRVARPTVAAQQVRVRVHAAGLNRADIVQRRGQYPAPPGWPADIPGLEYAGVVETIGEAVTQCAVGDRVMGLVGGGAMAEYVVVDQQEVLAIPAALTDVEAAAVPEAFLTAWDALTAQAHLAPGERVLIHAVGSGVGTAAIQCVRLLGGTSIGTSRTAEKLARCAALGLDEAIDSSDGAFASRLVAPVDIILDVLGAASFDENLGALAPRGRLVLLGFLRGSRGPVDLAPILRKRAQVIGTMMRPRVLAERVVLLRDVRARVLPHFGAQLRPVVGAVLPMTDLPRAQELMERDETFGKLVLTW